MLRPLAFTCALTCAAPVLAQATEASLKRPSAAMQLFERDWVLMNWALKFYDSNRDILIEPDEAQAAADSFRNLADADHDGRVTPQEYAAARAQILSRY